MSSVNDSAMSQKSVMESDLQFDFSNPKTAHDYVIIVEGVKFYVNSGILSVWSEKFSELFKKSPTKVKKLPLLEAGSALIFAGPLRDFYKPRGNVLKLEDVKEVKLIDIPAEDFKNFLMVVYPLEFQVDAFNYKGLIGSAFRFLAPAVLLQCKKFIEKEFNNLDAFELLELSIQYDMQDIKAKVEKFFKADPKIMKCSMNGHGYSQHIFCAKCMKNELTYLEANRNRIADLSLEAKAFVLKIICNI